jgi:PTH1 family peptidyl-tRNA hydrolase
MKIIISLGNPGDQYKNTRHNIAWLYLDYLLGPVKWTNNKKWSALTYETTNYLYVKPLSFMNNSGQVIQKILSFYKLLPKNFGLLTKKNANLKNELILIHDDLDLNFGTYKISFDSGSAGHRGVKSTINYLKTKKFFRLRLGIKNEFLHQSIPPEKFVLQNFSPPEKNQLASIFSQISIENIK